MEQHIAKRGDNVIVFPQTEIYVLRTVTIPNTGYKFIATSYDQPRVIKKHTLERIKATDNFRDKLFQQPFTVVDHFLQNDVTYIGIDITKIMDNDTYDPVTHNYLTVIFVPSHSTHNTNIHVMASFNQNIYEEHTARTGWTSTGSTGSTGTTTYMHSNYDSKRPANPVNKEASENDGAGVIIKRKIKETVDMSLRVFEKIKTGIFPEYKPINIDFKDDSKS